MAVQTDARAYRNDLTSLGRQTVATVLRLWARVDLADITRSWTEQIPQATAAVVGAQTVGAELADPYLRATLADDDQRVNVDGLAGQTAEGAPIGSLLYLPSLDALTRIGEGVAPADALREAGSRLAMYAQTTAADSGRLAVTAGMTARPHASGYYRMLQTPSCARCAIQAGKFFRYNTGFRRHPRCDCVHIPTREADDGLAFDARAAILAGRVTGISKRTREAIELGADPAQVVNARRGMYTAGGHRLTNAGTTRRGVAGARIIARDIDRALGVNVGQRTYRNWTFDRYETAKYAELFRRGKTYTRRTTSGLDQQYAYRYTQTPRPTPEEIVASTSSRDEAIRLLTNYGYLL